MFHDGMGFFQRNREAVLAAALTGIACCYLGLCAVNVFLALLLLAACVPAYAFYKNVDASFMLYIILLPFSMVPFFNGLPFGITGTRLQFVLLLVFILQFVLFKKPYRTGAVFNLFFILLLAIYIIAWARSTNYALQVFSSNLAGELSVFRYLIDYVSATFLAFIPLLAISYYIRDEKGIDRIVKTIAISIVLLVGYMIFVYIFRIGNKGDFEYIRAEFGKYVGLHGNDIANFFILTFPVILAWTLSKKRLFSLLTLLAILAGTLLCFSRTAYFLIIFAIFLYPVLAGKIRWVPVIALAAGLALIFLLPDMFVDRAVTGLNSGNSDELSAGRIEYIWGPLVNELENSPPAVVLFGSGRYGILNTAAWRQARITQVTHAHNMYLDGILDVGLIGLLAFLAFFGAVLLHFARNAKKYKMQLPYYANLLNGCIVSVLCYLLSGLSGRTFFPCVANIYLWMIIGLGIAICGYVREQGAGGIRTVPLIRPEKADPIDSQ